MKILTALILGLTITRPCIAATSDSTPVPEAEKYEVSAVYPDLSEKPNFAELEAAFEAARDFQPGVKGRYLPGACYSGPRIDKAEDNVTENLNMSLNNVMCFRKDETHEIVMFLAGKNLFLDKPTHAVSETEFYSLVPGGELIRKVSPNNSCRQQLKLYNGYPLIRFETHNAESDKIVSYGYYNIEKYVALEYKK